MSTQTIRRRAVGAGAIVFALTVGPIEHTSGFMTPSTPPTPSFDQRTVALPDVQISAARQRAEAELQVRRPSTRVDYDGVTGSPAWVSRLGFLSKTTEEEIQRTGDLGLAKDDPHRAIKAFLVENMALFGHGPEVLSNATITSEFVTEHNGMRTVVWQQQLDDIPVFEGLLIGHITKQGQLVNISSHFLPNIELALGLDGNNQLDPAVSAPQAVAYAVANLGEAITVDAVSSLGGTLGTTKQQVFNSAAFLGEAKASLVWLPMNRSSVYLCWCVQFMSRSTAEGFQTLVDAKSGEVLVRQNRTRNFTAASYRVYSSDSPSPFTPGWSTPSSVQPTVVSRQLVTLAALSQTASPQGWIRDTDNLTVGNNVDASVNLNGQDPNLGPRPQGSPFRVFDFSLNLNDDPIAYGDAAAVNLFYWCNWMHDKLYGLGFTEAARNFQDDNFGKGGVPGDRVLAYAQWSGANNAFFTTWPDGRSGVMKMFKWTGPSPDRDGDIDSEIILHEYTHGMSNRRVGGGVGLTHLQSIGLDEGWSDFYPLALLSQSSDNVSGNFPIMGYGVYQLLGLTENYYYGARRYPYTVNISKNPLTFNDIDPFQADNCNSGAPYSPLWVAWYGSCEDNPSDEPHNIGEVWCVALWEARNNLINKYGYTAGNNLILQLVTDGMNLCPPNPNFIQARDAILQADVVANCAFDWVQLWSAFAKRGLGWYATAPPSNLTSPVEESFVIAPLTGEPCKD